MNNNFNITNLVRPNVAQLEAYSSARDEYKAQTENMIFLDANENPYATDVNRYPDPNQRNLKQKLAEIKQLAKENILLGNGSDEVLDLLYRAFCEPAKDNVITLPPTYGMYKVLANINNIENREVLLNNQFQPNVELILSKIDKHTKLLFLCSPNNPTGNTFSEERVRRILENFSGLVLIDEAYIDFSAKESWLKKLKEFPNLVVVQTLSKAYGMAGIRLGACFASKEIIAILKKIKPPYNVNQLTQQRALQRILDKDSIKKEVADILAEKRNLLKVLNEVKFIQKIFPSDANFILIRVDDAEKRYAQLIEKGIVIRNRATQPLCENTLRFTVGTPQENIRLMQALKSLS